MSTSSENMVEELFFDFIVRNGRAVLLMVGRDMYERRAATGARERGPNRQRDLVTGWSKDLGRSIDYLETRNDLVRDKVGYCGVSSSAWFGAIQAALEPRIKASILIAGGLVRQRPPPEVDPFHFAPRVKTPVLMINGRYDSHFPVETNQLILFRLLGTPEHDKRHVLFESGHIPPMQGIIKEALDWLDRYLGPVM